ncbi:transcriptional regulator [Rhizobium azibense]|uniref:Transcriptional regulator n=1 Tax=Rhizobium azibense TaxID=1136135 RepID=A0A4R3R1S1_9HYPH|nr:metalloregulator ArsR/SmtB family transcription factor [Rhizobium azibense]TCU27747.1 transcriptional regulator [Rhizobium azibense]TCU34534.1 transcriptional regulator [Rhizobium azibense]
MRHSPASRILLLIKTDGPQRAASIGDVLGITCEAARQQLTKLAADGLVEPLTEPGSGRGRPGQLWHLTPAGNQTFPDGHAELTATLLSTMVETLGRDALDTIISAREAETVKRYRKEVSSSELALRVRQLSAIRTREGYMADSWMEDDGSFMLVENHCPICAAARACAGFCRSELETFGNVLGAKVERCEHILLGARRCAYRISPL